MQLSGHGPHQPSVPEHGKPGNARDGNQLQQKVQITMKDHGDRQVWGLASNSSQQIRIRPGAGNQGQKQPSDFWAGQSDEAGPRSGQEISPQIRVWISGIDGWTQARQSCRQALLQHSQAWRKGPGLSWNGTLELTGEKCVRVVGVPRGGWSGPFRLLVPSGPWQEQWTAYHWEKLRFKVFWKGIATHDPEKHSWILKAKYVR